MAWKITTEWAAGFFDGEGCVSIARRFKGNGPWLEHFLAVETAQNDKRPLDAMAKKYGGSTKGDKTVSGCYRWRIAGKIAEGFLEDIYPHTIVKREQIKIALELRSTIGSAGKRLSANVHKRREAIYKKFIATKKRT